MLSEANGPYLEAVHKLTASLATQSAIRAAILAYEGVHKLIKF